MADWQVLKLERPQPRPYYVARQISESQWEQLRTADGALARFETAEEAADGVDLPDGAKHG